MLNINAREKITMLAVLMVVFAFDFYCEASFGANVDLGEAVIVHGNNPRHIKAADFLADEIEIRSGVRLEAVSSCPNDVPAILLGDVNDFPESYVLPVGISEPVDSEGYAIWSDTSGGQAKVYLLGADERGTLFAAGRLIRLLNLGKGHIGLDEDIRLEDWPDAALRGHQIAYRRLNNTNDAWTIEQYEQYIRDLIIFGTNSFEFIPLLNLNTIDGPHSVMSTGDMDSAVSQILDDYGLDMWLWKAIYQRELGDPGEYEATLAAWRGVFESLPRLNGMFVPGADGGDLTVQQMAEWLSRLYPELTAVHPEAKLWVSNQGWSEVENEWFFDYLTVNEPTWLEGVVYGPWGEITLPQLRAGTPAQYKLRRYPDITHSMNSQYPVYQWDRAFLHTLGREPIAARISEMRDIYKAFEQYADGFITYSDGVHDDLNKVVWSSLGWDSNADVNDILYDYGKVFFGYDFRKDPKLAGDFDGDLIIDANDLKIITDDWLEHEWYEYIYEGNEPNSNGLMLWYKFDETSGLLASDSSDRGLSGAINGPAAWDSNGFDYSGCLSFNDDTAIEVPTEVLNGIDDQLTVSVWQWGYRSAEDDGTRRDNYVFDTGAGDYYVTTIVPTIPETVTFRAGMVYDVVTWTDCNESDYQFEWKHYLFTKSGPVLRIFRDGEMVAEKSDATASIAAVAGNTFDVGAAVTHVNDYKGKLDDFRVYSRLLGDDEIAWLAGQRVYKHPLDSQADIYTDGIIDFKDYALLAAGFDSDSEDTGQWVNVLAEDVTDGLWGLQRNWTGLLKDNTGVEDTLALWRFIAEDHDQHSQRNWRLEMFLFRAMYDAYLQRKLFYEADYEHEANIALIRAYIDGSDLAIENAQFELDQIDILPAEVQSLRDEIEALGLKLFEDIGIQLSTAAPYLGHGSTRGCVLDWMDTPLNDKLWLQKRFAAILAEPNEADRLDLIYKTVFWEEPVVGAIYDDLGGANDSPRLVRQKSWEQDPGGMESPIYDGYYGTSSSRLSQLDNIETRYGAPLMMRYDGLDPNGIYDLRVTYSGRYNATTTLTADGVYTIHGLQKQPSPIQPTEYPIPQAATADGVLELQWDLVSGRGTQLGEIWLIKE